MKTGAYWCRTINYLALSKQRPSKVIKKWTTSSKLFMASQPLNLAPVKTYWSVSQTDHTPAAWENSYFMLPAQQLLTRLNTTWSTQVQQRKYCANLSRNSLQATHGR